MQILRRLKSNFQVGVCLIELSKFYKIVQVFVMYVKLILYSDLIIYALLTNILKTKNIIKEVNVWQDKNCIRSIPIRKPVFHKLSSQYYDGYVFPIFRKYGCEKLRQCKANKDNVGIIVKFNRKFLLCDANLD